MPLEGAGLVRHVHAVRPLVSSAFALTVLLAMPPRKPRTLHDLLRSGRTAARWLVAAGDVLAGPIGPHLNAFRLVAGVAAVATLLFGGGEIASDVVLGTLTVLNFACVRSWRRTMVALEAFAAAADRLAAAETSSPVSPAAASRDPRLAALAASLVRLHERLARLLEEREVVVERGGEEVERIAATMEEMSAAGEELAATIQELSAEAGARAVSVERAAAAAQTISAATEEVVSAGAEATGLNAAVRQLAEEQQAAMVEVARSVGAFTGDVNSAVARIQTLAASSERTARFVDLVRGITRQTNMLALNASIEAARAGEEGRGFTVIAEEVRKLAGQAAKAAEEIESVIREMTREIRRVEAMLDGCGRTGEMVAGGVGEAAQGFDHVVRRMREADEHVAVVQAGVEEIERQIRINGAALEEMSVGVTQLAAAAQEMAATSEEMAAGLGELAGTSARLHEMLRPAEFEVAPSTEPYAERGIHVRGAQRTIQADHLRTHERIHA